MGSKENGDNPEDVAESDLGETPVTDTVGCGPIEVEHRQSSSSHPPQFTLVLSFPKSGRSFYRS